jgi:transposase
MGRPVKLLSGVTLEELEAMRDKCTDAFVLRKLIALVMKKRGHSAEAAGQAVGVKENEVYVWARNFDAEGLEGLKRKPGQGGQFKLDKEQEAEVARWLLEHTPQDFGQEEELWDGPTLKKAIDTRLKIEYCESSIYNLFDRLGFSPQRHKKRFPGADPKRRAAFEEEVKKKRGTESRSCGG